jgi:hypothetical protein
MMAITFDIRYPPELTNAAWQKQKSLTDKTKSATKTGLGELLIKAEQEWKKIKFDILMADKLKPKLAGQVNTAYLALLKASRKAHDTSQNKALSPSAITAAQKLSNNLQLQALKLKGIKLVDFDDKISILQARAEKLARVYQHQTEEFERQIQYLGKVTKDVSEAWEDAALPLLVESVRKLVAAGIKEVGGPAFDKQLEDDWLGIMVSTKMAQEEIGGPDERCQATISRLLSDTESERRRVRSLKAV